MAAGLDRETLAPPEPDAEVRSTALSPIAGKTGYPAEMLELDLDLQTDLGADMETRP